MAGCLTAGPTVRRFVLTAGHQPPTKLCRHGFTLVELLLVLALIVTVGAIAWPSIQHGYDNFKLKRAADQVVTAFGHARVQAMSKGLTQVFRCESGTPRYTVEVLPDETMPVDDGTAGLGSAPAGGGNSQNQSTSSKAGQLPDGYVFSNAQRVLDNRAAATETELSSSGTSGDLPPILFYPDGTSSEAFVTVSDKNGLSVSVSIRGLTSFARTGDIFRSQATSP